MVVYKADYKASDFVELDDFEVTCAAACGVRIFEWSQEHGLSDRIDDKEQGRRNQALGALMERGVAKSLDLYWSAAFRRYQGSDLSHKIEVRLIGVNRYGLRVYEKDKGKHVVGVVVEKGKERGYPYRLAGWIEAEDAMREEWKLDPNEKGQPFFGVPQSELRPMGELARKIVEEKAAQLDGTVEWPR